MPRMLNLAGQKFGRLTAIRIIENIKGRVFWECICECGKVTCVQSTKLRFGSTKSCGCYAAELASIRRRKHMMSVSSEYRAWQSMRKRCYDKNCEQYKNYGGRGISVCERWRESFQNFFEDVGRKPQKNMSLNRKNNDGNYEPGNCQWDTPKIQARNTRHNRIITFNGQSKPVTEWAEATGIHNRTIRARIDVQRWSVEKALTTPVVKIKNC